MKKITLSLILISGLFLAGCSQQSTDTNETLNQSESDQITDQSGQVIDLTNCLSYYDGCNNCMVESGKVTACTLMYCEKPNKPTCTQYKQPETTNQNQAPVDLTNCTNYYDGCNTCFVKDGVIGGCTKMACEKTGKPTCLEYIKPTQPETPTACTMEYAPVCAKVAIQCIKAPCNPIEQTFGNKCQLKANKLATYLYDGECKSEKNQIANPASVYCEQQGGTLEIKTASDGSQNGICNFPTGSCEERALMRGECSIKK